MRVCLSCSAIGCCTCMKRHLRGPSSVEIVCAQRRELSLSVHPVPLTPPPDVSMSRFLRDQHSISLFACGHHSIA